MLFSWVSFNKKKIAHMYVFSLEPSYIKMERERAREREFVSSGHFFNRPVFFFLLLHFENKIKKKI